MKCKQICFFAVLALLSVTSCKKNSTPTYPVSGVYTGTYTVDNLTTQGALAYSISIFPDGSITTKGKISDTKDGYSVGTWALTGSTAFSATINTIGGSGTSVTQTITATFSNTGTLTSGTWKDIYNTGKFSVLQRVN